MARSPTDRQPARARDVNSCGTCAPPHPPSTSGVRVKIDAKWSAGIRLAKHSGLCKAKVAVAKSASNGGHT
jgi:hypothetical protein